MMLKEVASLFSAGIRGDMSPGEKKKALTETILRIKKNSLEIKSMKAIEQNNAEELQKIIAEQVRLQKLHISYKDG